MHLPDLISDLALILLVAGVMTLLFKKIRQPIVLGYLIAGFIAGPYFNLFPSVSDTVSINVWSEIGVIILMFSLGLEFNLHKLASVGGTAIIAAITEVISMLIIGSCCGRLMGWSPTDSIYLGGMLSMSSTTIIIKAFDDLKLKGKKFTELVFGTLVVEDIAGIFMMVMLSTVAVSKGVSGGDLAGILIKMVFYLVLWLLLGIYLLPTLLRKAKGLFDDEILLIVSLGICLGMVMLANHLGFSSALGSFLAGSLLAGTIHAEKIEHLNKPVKDLFGAVFFISVGMMVDPALVVKYLIPIFIITIVAIFIKASFSTLGVLLSGQSLHMAVLCGCSLAQIGEFSFIIASLGISLGVISNYIYPIIVSVSVITTFTTPFVIKSAEGVYGFLNSHLPSRVSSYLNRFTSEDQTETEKDSDWLAFIKDYFSHLAIYSVVMLGIIYIAASFLQPFLAQHLNQSIASILTVIATIILMAPFLRQCLFKKNKYFISLWFKNRTNHLPLLALIVLRMGIMIFLSVLPIRNIYQISILQTFLASAACILLITRADWLISPYLKIEAQFLANFYERQLNARKGGCKDHSWLDEQIYVGKIVCDEKSQALNKPLNEFMNTLHSGLKIIKIIRNGHHINIPKGTEKLHAGDIVFMAGSMVEMDNLSIIRRALTAATTDIDYVTLRDFIKHQEQYDEAEQLFCFAATVDKDSDLVGIRIKDSKIKNEWFGFLLGIERELYPIVSPDVNMRIRENDLVWVLGPQRMVGKLAKNNLL